MEILGKPSIHPVVFYTGKCFGYVCWIILLLSILGVRTVTIFTLKNNREVGIFLMFLGLIISVWSTFNLGKSTRLGLPISNTSLKLKGLYKYTRNPIYLGFGFITIASIIYTLNLLIIIMGVYSVLIYHFIILSEEKFLLNRFGKDYLNYKLKVNRYL